MKKFWGSDFGIIALAKNYPANDIQITISAENPAKNYFCESDLWFPAVKNITEEKTKFGRIGIFFDRKNKKAESFCQTLAKQKFNYKQRNTRAENSAKFSFFQTQILKEMANEGLANSVEFRRILRKYVRNTKDLHLDSVLFLDSIFAEKKTRQIIAKIAGTQIKTYFLTDFISAEFELDICQDELSSNSKKSQNPSDSMTSHEKRVIDGINADNNKNQYTGGKKSFTIKTDDNLEFTKKRAEQILQKKLKNENITELS